MKFPEAFLDEIRARMALSAIIGRKVAWDARKSEPRKRHYWACCPFHSEKTPSFHCEDDKGRYHCFGCKASGDHFAFLIEREGMTFPEAVTFLAQEAGLALPAQSPEDEAREKLRLSLYQVVELAAQFYERQLASEEGAEALAYLERRGVKAELRACFRLGYAPKTRGSLIEAMRSHKIDADALLQAGLTREVLGKNPHSELMRGRLIFPIEDARGRVVAFGGRVLVDDPAIPKYLNTPETPLFSKGKLLYNHHRARETGEIIACEGYMDTIAIAGAGLAHVVAPLGTAISEHHLELLWRMADEPAICLDGDEAGQKAALRVMALALPLLKPGKSLRFVGLAAGQDPDDMIKAMGPEAFTAEIAKARPLFDILWQSLTDAADIKTPERRAKFQTAIAGAAAKIADDEVRKHYEAELATRLKTFWKEKGVKPPGLRFEKKPKDKAADIGAGKGGDGLPGFDEEDIEEMNRLYAVVITGQRAAILMDSAVDAAASIERVRFMNVDAFRLWNANNRAFVYGRWQNRADLWLESRKRRQYRGIEFAPAPPGKIETRDGFFDLWRGFTVKPARNPDLSMPWLDHVRENVAGGDDVLFDWIVSWFAWMIQHPRRRLGVSLALRGGEGAGKTITGRIIGSLFPANYFLIDDPRYLMGQFNSHLASCLLLQADESFWAGDKQAEGRIKGLITSDFQMIEYKGVDPIRLPNYVSLMITSNEDWVVPVGLMGRRFAVVDASPRKLQDHKYFAELAQLYERPDAQAALLYELATWHIDELALRKVPKTEALFTQKQRTFDPFVGWLHELLMEGGMVPGADWPDWVETQDLHGHYLKRCERLGLRHPLGRESFGTRLRKMMPGVKRAQKSSDRKPVYVFPALDLARKAFSDQVDYEVDWENEGVITTVSMPPM